MPYWHVAALHLFRSWWRSKFPHHHKQSVAKRASVLSAKSSVVAGTGSNSGYQRLGDDDLESGMEPEDTTSRMSVEMSRAKHKSSAASPDNGGRRRRRTRSNDIEDGSFHNKRGDGSGSDSSDSEGEEAALSLEDMKKELRSMTDKTEELEVRVASQKKSSTEAAVELRSRLRKLQDARAELKSDVDSADQISAEQQAAELAKQNEPKKQTFMTAFLKGPVVQIITRAMNGIMSVSLYFADLYSDLSVVDLLWKTQNFLWAWLSIVILVAQFVVVWLRVIPYVDGNFGSDSSFYKLWLLFGFPFGCLAFDGLMFLEPFGLLTVLPIPDWLRQFVPAYKATRIIAEVAIESLPQCLLQSYIYIVVVQAAAAGTATPNQLAMIDFVSLLPKVG